MKRIILTDTTIQLIDDNLETFQIYGKGSLFFELSHDTIYFYNVHSKIKNEVFITTLPITINDTEYFTMEEVTKQLVNFFEVKYNVISGFIEKVIADNGIVDEYALRTVYDQIPNDIISTASEIIIPGAYKESVVYGIQMKTNTLKKYDFERSSVGSFIGLDNKLQIANINMPRVDYVYYSNELPKLLLEPERQNFRNRLNNINLTQSRAILAVNSSNSPIFRGIDLEKDSWYFMRESSNPGIKPEIGISTYHQGVYTNPDVFNPSFDPTIFPYSMSYLVEPEINTYWAVFGLDPSYHTLILKEKWNHEFTSYLSFPNESSKLRPAGGYSVFAPTGGYLTDFWDKKFWIDYYQLEYGLYATSYIPKTSNLDSGIRNQDKLFIPIEKTSTIKIYTAQKQTIETNVNEGDIIDLSQFVINYGNIVWAAVI